MTTHSEKPIRSRRGLELATILVFFAVLLAPTVDSFVRSDFVRGPRFELRSPNPKPRAPTSLADLNLWPLRYEKFYNDVFGLRDYCLHAYNWLRLSVLRTPVNRNYVVGEGDWLFYAGDGALDDFRGASPLDERALELWKRRLEARRDWLSERGIRYMFVVAPNKESIYPEHYDRRYERLGPTRLDQLATYLGAHSDVDFVDLRGVLLEEKRRIADSEPLYSPPGTHWIARGAAAGARGIAERVARFFPSVHPLEFDELEPNFDVALNDSALPGLYLSSSARLDFPVYVRKGGAMHDFGSNSERALPGRRVSTRQADTRLPKAMIFHDSFAPYAEQLLAESFSELTLIWQYGLDSEEIEAAHPDLVLELVVERVLSRPELFEFTPQERGGEWKRSKEVVGTYVPSRDSALLQVSPGLECLLFTSARDDFLRIESHASSSWIEFPPAMLGDGRDLRVRMEIQTRVACKAWISVECRGGGPERELQALALDAGRNVAYFDFDGADVQGAMRFYWSGDNELLLRKIEVRRSAH